MANGRMTLTKMLRQFGYKRLQKIRGGAHAGKIGEWVRWWISGRPNRRMVITPAPMTNWKGKSFLADILFLEKPRKTEIYKILGVAEIENSFRKAVRKLKSLRAYEQNESQYPDLKFVLLCLSLFPTLERRPQVLRKIQRYLERFSKDSRLRWVLYLLIYEKAIFDQVDYAIKIIDYVVDSDYFYYNTEISSAEWFVYRDGEIAYRWKKSAPSRIHT